MLDNDVLLTLKVDTLGTIQVFDPLSQNIQIHETIQFFIDPNKIQIYDEETRLYWIEIFSKMLKKFE